MKGTALLYRILSVLVLVLALLGQTSCATAPAPVPGAEKDPFAELPQGADVLFYGDIQKNHRLISELYRLGSVKILQRVPQKSLNYAGQIYGALYKKGSPQRFYVLISGAFPVFRTNLSLTFNPDWKWKQAGGLSYWRSKKDGLSLQLTSRRLTISDAEPERMASIAAVPETANNPAEARDDNLLNLADELSRSTVFIVFNSPEPLVKNIMDGFGDLDAEIKIPLKQIRLELYPASVSGSYVLQTRLVTASPIYGKALGALLTLASQFIQPISLDMDQTGEGVRSDQVFNYIGTLLLSESPKVEGPLVSLTSKPMTEAELTLLLHRLLVYFDGTKIL